MPSKLDFLREHMAVLRDALKNISEDNKKNKASLHQVEDFNEKLKGIKAECPEAVEHLPKELATKSRFNRVGQTDITLLDLEVQADRVLRVVALASKHR
jgi:hypothetical protein